MCPRPVNHSTGWNRSRSEVPIRVKGVIKCHEIRMPSIVIESFRHTDVSQHVTESERYSGALLVVPMYGSQEYGYSEKLTNE